MKFFLKDTASHIADMGISPRTVRWLKSNGYDAIHLVEEGLEKLPDDEILVRRQ